MDIVSFRDYCLSKKGVTEETPFGPDTLVFKVLGKMYALCGMTDEEFRCNLKCDPEYALELRDQYPEIIPGWHMNKKHWNTVFCEKELDDRMIADLVDHSYDLVVASLSKAQKEILNRL
ncbi:MmcQ/YjbR family DNA-binding protein [Portibacter marinus]|uniref:MmcQ/YjbR family DNA-binding protein n=1 Tax=Portibacter marinus TaxID=2898660 RepID=UPI001F43B286|nr:MmcQ/YjbR family DNA-binding protein [Portibacter marinus]